LRAAAPGANHGILSTPSLVIGVTASGAARGDVLLPLFGVLAARAQVELR
jgi:hypothetical protein